MQEMLGVYALSLLFLFISVEAIKGFYRSDKHSFRDKLFIAAGFAHSNIILTPLVTLVVGLLLTTTIPQYAGGLESAPFLPCFLSVFLLEDLSHYWVHRLAHDKRWMWRLHRTHHSGTSMNVGLIFRTNLFWTFLIPTQWFALAAIYLGKPEVFLALLGIKLTINTLTHTVFRWDDWLRSKSLSKHFIWSFERIFTTPRTHHAHHGFGKNGKPMRNFATVLILWDIIFKTAYFPDEKPKNIGLPNSNKLYWAEELFWPLIREKK